MSKREVVGTRHLPQVDLDEPIGHDHVIDDLELGAGEGGSGHGRRYKRLSPPHAPPAKRRPVSPGVDLLGATAVLKGTCLDAS